MAPQARVKIHKMRKVSTTDEVFQDLLKNDPAIQAYMKEIAEEIRDAAQENFTKKGHPEVKVTIRESQGVNRTNVRIAAESTDPAHEGAAPYIEAKYGAMKKAVRAVKRARKQAGNA